MRTVSWPSPLNTRAMRSSRNRSRFSAKFSLEPMNHFAPIIVGESSRTFSQGWEACTWPNSQTAAQKSSLLSTDHW